MKRPRFNFMVIIPLTVLLAPFAYLAGYVASDGWSEWTAASWGFIGIVVGFYLTAGIVAAGFEIIIKSFRR